MQVVLEEAVNLAIVWRNIWFLYTSCAVFRAVSLQQLTSYGTGAVSDGALVQQLASYGICAVWLFNCWPHRGCSVLCEYDHAAVGFLR